jgi:hypothetical protein
MRRRTVQRQPKRSENDGFGSGFERTAYNLLKTSGVTFEYESDACKFQYIKSIHRGLCSDCGSSKVGGQHEYTADFYVKNNSGKEYWVEIKGGGYSWTPATRAKHILLRDQFPDKEIRFVFCNENALIKKGSKTTNKQWCKRYGFVCAGGKFPKAWLEEE